MKTVYKYPLYIVDAQVVNLPAGAVVLHIAPDPQGKACLWAFVDTDRPLETRSIVVTGTGHEVPDGLEHLGSFVQEWGVWHVWERV